VKPTTPIFGRLLRHAYRNRLAIRDDSLGIKKTYGELLSDVLSLRYILRESLDHTTLRHLHEKGIYIGILGPGGYEYTVAMLAVIAIGAAAVPMGEISFKMSIEQFSHETQLLPYPWRKQHTSLPS
jgi:malonyl-CoA/methylmalonyl-CoA synthetase